MLWFFCSIETVIGFGLTSELRGGSKRASRRATTNLLASSLPAQLEAEIKQYVAKRRDTDGLYEGGLVSLEAIEATKKARLEAGGGANAVAEMVKPTGWFKDTVALELKSRTDGAIPILPHPLAFFELDRFGFGHLSEQIIELGGPEVVGNMVGIKWSEPVYEQPPVDESLRPVREQTFALDMSGSLLLGVGLDDRLSAAADLDLGALKQQLQERENVDGTNSGDIFNLSKEGSESVDGIDYSQLKSSKYARGSSAAVPKAKFTASDLAAAKVKGERFSLDGTQRAFFFLSSAAVAVAYGRASTDIIEHSLLGSSGLDRSLISAAQYVSLFLSATSVGSALLSAKQAKEKSRSVFIWASQGLFGGPLTLQKLAKLEAVSTKDLF